jgi:hypothetical protein
MPKYSANPISVIIWVCEYHVHKYFTTAPPPFSDLPHNRSRAASLMGVSGLMGHITNNNIDYLVLTVMGAAAMIGGYLGAKYTNQFSDKILKRNIGMIWVVVAITTFLRASDPY